MEIELVTAKGLFEQAVALHRAGDKAKAEALYRKFLEREPGHDQALYLSSVLAVEAGRLEAARELSSKAAELSPENAVYAMHLGDIDRRLGRTRAAIESLVRAVSLDPELVHASYNLGLALGEAGDVAAAIRCFERAADLEPGLFVVQHALARALEAHGELLRAVGHYHAALALDPESIDARYDLCDLLRRLKRLHGAVALGRRMLALDPHSAPAHVALGAALLDREALDEAADVLERAVELAPELAAAHFFLANVARERGELDAALAHYRSAAELAPDDAKSGSNLVYTLAFVPNVTTREIQHEASAWARRHAPSTVAQNARENAPAPARRLRIGYVSPDFREHVQASFTLPLFRNHDRDAVEVFCYASVERSDAVTDEIRASVEHFRDVLALDDAALAELVRSDGIDVLVDLTLHMANGRLGLFARKPAPVAVTWLGYPGTTGVEAIDYRITDPHLDPPGTGAGDYTEASLCLPDTFWCYDPRTAEPEPGDLPATERGYVTFGCLNAFIKVNPAVLELWSRVLGGVPRSRLVLLAPPGRTRARLLETFARHGVEAERITFVGRRPRAEYLRGYRELDVCLDTFPYNGHTTSLDALFMGVPIVTLVGETVVGRAGLSQAMNLGLAELVARTPDEYVERAVALASDLPALSELRRGLRSRMQASPLMNGDRFARNLEAAFRSVARRPPGGR
jgi:predicted O-linked N-acetylglucosamine transferase (SPINDLY family)